MTAAPADRSAGVRTRRWTRRTYLVGRAVLRYVLSVGVVVLLWHLLASRIDNHVLLPTPYRVVRSMYRLWTAGDGFLWHDGGLVEDYIISVRRLFIGYAAAAVVAILLGIAMGLRRVVYELVDPVVELIRPISALAWIPLWLALVGISKSLPFVIIFSIALFPLLLNTVAGIRAANPVLIRAVRSMGVTDSVVVRRVILPDALPSVLVGARIAMGNAWMALIASELIGAPDGLGFNIIFFGSTLRTSDMMAVIVVIAISGYLTDLALRLLHRRLTPWRPADVS